MHGLPIMKHTNRGDAAAKRNTLVCTIPGIKNPVEIAFQSRKLPVCKKCKKIYKTRDLCRVRDQHTDLPWNTTYICFLVDDSCLVSNRNGKFMMVQQQQHSSPYDGSSRRDAAAAGGDQDADDNGYYIAETIDVPTNNAGAMCLNARHDEEEAHVLQQGLKNFRIGLDKLGPNPPICHDCKEKNYTRHYCRIHHSHTHLPWNTTYAWLKKRADTATAGGNFLPTGVDSTNNTRTTTLDEVDYPRTGNIPMDFMMVDHKDRTRPCNGSKSLDVRTTTATSNTSAGGDAYNHLKRQWSAFDLEENPSVKKKSKRIETEILDGTYSSASSVAKDKISHQRGCVDPGTVGENRNAHMAFLLVIHEGNLTLHMLRPEKENAQVTNDASDNTSILHTSRQQNHLSKNQSTPSYHIIKNEDSSNTMNNVSGNRNQESFDNECFPPVHSYDSRDPPESSSSISKAALGHDQQSSSPFFNSGHLFEPIPYNPNCSYSHYEYGPTHATSQQHNHSNSLFNIFDAPPPQQEQDPFVYSQCTNTATDNAPGAESRYPSAQPHYYSHEEERESRIDLYECRQPPSPSSYNHISIEPVDDYDYYCYNSDHYEKIDYEANNDFASYGHSRNERFTREMYRQNDGDGSHFIE